MTPKKFGIFIGISLLLHLVLLLIMAFGWLKAMQWEPEPPRQDTVRITLAERPPAPLPEPLQQRRPFVDTSDSVKIDEADPDAVFQGAENTRAMSETAGENATALPNLTGEESNSMNLRDTNYSPQVKSTPSTSSTEQQETEPLEKQEEQEKKEGEIAETDSARDLLRDPQASFLTREEMERRKQLLEEKRKQLEARDASQASAAPMAFSAQKRQTLLPGGADIGAQNSFGAEQTDLGRYKQKLYRAIGSRWYVYVEEFSGFISLGQVKIRFYVRSDGVFEQLQVIAGDRSSQLHMISRRSIMENSGQLEPFSESMREQLGDGYWEEISFTIRN